MMTTTKAAVAASLLFAVGALAQDDAAAPDTYVLSEAGDATHNDTGAVCPKTIGDMLLAQVLSFDSAQGHFGIGCQYLAPTGFTATLSIMKTTAVELVGPGTEADRWNSALYSILGSYPSALPAAAPHELEGDDATGLRGALFTANANGLPVRIGVWQLESGDWQYRAQAIFVPMSANGWEIAEQTRAALVAAKASADAS